MGRTTGWSRRSEIYILCRRLLVVLFQLACLFSGWHECRKRLKIRPAQNTSDRLGRPFRYLTHLDTKCLDLEMLQNKQVDLESKSLWSESQQNLFDIQCPWKALRKSINGLVNKVNVPWLRDVCSSRNDPSKIFSTASCLPILKPRWETSKTSWRSHTWHRS